MGWKLLHDRELFAAALNHVKGLDNSAREGEIFGYPAIFVGRRIVLCVYGSGIGIRLPEQHAAQLLASGRAFPFQPYGRSTMREWVQIRVPRERLDDLTPMLTEAIRFVRGVDERA